MNTYIFRTEATMKPYNYKKWWISRDVVGEKIITAASVKDALKQYAELVRSRDYIEISKSAIRNAAAMYMDTKNGERKQVGYVMTAKTDFDNDGHGWVQQFIELWVEVVQAVEAF